MKNNQRERKKVYIDFDGTIANSIQAFFETYIHKHWEEIQEGAVSMGFWQFTKKWDMKDELPYLMPYELKEIFESTQFFNRLNFYYADNGFSSTNMVRTLINTFNRDYEFIIASCGTEKNLRIKKQMCESLFRDLFDLNHLSFMGILTDTGTDKSCLEGFLLIDDNQDALYSADVKYRALANFHYIKETEWNCNAVKDENILIANDPYVMLDIITALLLRHANS